MCQPGVPATLLLEGRADEDSVELLADEALDEGGAAPDVGKLLAGDALEAARLLDKEALEEGDRLVVDAPIADELGTPDPLEASEVDGAGAEDDTALTAADDASEMAEEAPPEDG